MSNKLIVILVHMVSLIKLTYDKYNASRLNSFSRLLVSLFIRRIIVLIPYWEQSNR